MRSRGWMVSYLEQLLRDVLSPGSRAAATHQATTFANRPAVRVTWRAELQQVDALVFSRDGAVYVIITQDHSDKAFTEVTRDFSLLP